MFRTAVDLLGKSGKVGQRLGKPRAILLGTKKAQKNLQQAIKELEFRQIFGIQQSVAAGSDVQALSPYALFTAVKSVRGPAGSLADTARARGEEWKALGEEEKAKWNTFAEIDRSRFGDVPGEKPISFPQFYKKAVAPPKVEVSAEEKAALAEAKKNAALKKKAIRQAKVAKAKAAKKAKQEKAKAKKDAAKAKAKKAKEAKAKQAAALKAQKAKTTAAKKAAAAKKKAAAAKKKAAAAKKSTKKAAAKKPAAKKPATKRGAPQKAQKRTTATRATRK